MSVPPADDVLGIYRGRVVLVVGAGGFIGRRLSAGLGAAGAAVVEVVRGGSGEAARRSGGSRREIGTDLMAEGSAAELVRMIQPDAIFNLAGYGVSPTQREEAAAIRLNIGLPAELAQACAGIGQNTNWPGLSLIHTGSALEYGVAAGDLAESTPAHPTTLYGRTKLAGTLAIASAAASGRIRAVTARLFTVYGPGEMEGRLLPGLLRARRTVTPIPLTDGAQRRDFTYVDDVVEGLLRLAALRSAPDPIVNLATGRLATVRDFVLRAAGVLGLHPDRLAFGALATRPEEMAHDPVSVVRLRALTGWQPETSIEEGVQRTAAAANASRSSTPSG